MLPSQSFGENSMLFNKIKLQCFLNVKKKIVDEVKRLKVQA